MNETQNKIDELKLKIYKLEKEKKFQDLLHKKKLIEYNLNIIKKILENINTNINENKYVKLYPLAKLYDKRLLYYLEPIYNLLKITNERLDNIENEYITN